MKQSHVENKRLLLVVLPLIALICLSIWYVRNYYHVDDMIKVASKTELYDLHDQDFDSSFYCLEGEVSYLPGIFTPEEFATKEAELQTGNPWDLPSATSRLRILVPENSTYTITASSIDFAHRVYINGELRFAAGNPADNAADFIPGHEQMTIDVKPVNGMIEIIQQGANYVHREGGGHTDLYIGTTDAIHQYLALSAGPEYIYIGLFAALFLIHLILYVVQRTYRPNLFFSFLCLTWMIRTGITGMKVFFEMFPALSWELAFRMEYLTLPIAAIFLVLLIRSIFPTITEKWFVTGICIGSILFSILCVGLDTITLSYMLFYYEAFFSLGILYLFLRFMIKVPKVIKEGQFLVEHWISLVALGFFMVATINDAFYHAGVFHALGFQKAFMMTGLAMLITSMFQMTAMFYGTMRETLLAHEREQKAEAEKELLSEMNRMKSAFYSDLSHEMKTPLTVIAVNAQFAAQNISLGAIDEETITDLNAISAEAKRLAQMVTSLVGIGRMQGVEGEITSLNLENLILETTRIYQTLFARKKNTLDAEVAQNLPHVQGNADQLIQVLINLLSNANRHTSQGHVHIIAKATETNVYVQVIDNGSGISAELLPHVFERYCHGEAGGSGLGLSICKKIIEEHHGTIGVESEEGKGTTVWFILPVREEKVV